MNPRSIDKQQAQELIKETFESSFDKSGFTNFIKNLLNRIDDASQLVPTHLFNRIKYAS